MDFPSMIKKTTADHFEKEFLERNEYLASVVKLSELIIFNIRNPETKSSRSIEISEKEMLSFSDPFEELLRERLFSR